MMLVKGDFSDDTWQAFWRLAVEGQSAPSIAAELGLSPSAVRQAKYRVLCRLREELAGL
jgi:RNA polymerase sigma-70 factor (ECF subfamily)